MHKFLTSLQPPKIEITKNYISTNKDFINGIIIEKISVDSIGKDGLPTKYTVDYWTRCSIDHAKGKSPDKITFKATGNYSWVEGESYTQYIHKGLQRETVNGKNQFPFSTGLKRLPICPMKFEKEQWYFIKVGDPQVTGIFFMIDKNGKKNQYFIPSGISPI